MPVREDGEADDEEVEEAAENVEENIGTHYSGTVSRALVHIRW